MEPACSLNVPETMEIKWIGEPNPTTAERYASYYRNRKLLDSSESWSSWGFRHATRNIFTIVQTSAAWVYQGFSSTATMLIVKNEVPYHTAAKVAHSVHGIYTAKTRTPIDHNRVDAAVEKLRSIQKNPDAHLLIERIQSVYTKGYLSSKASSNLMTNLTLLTLAAVKIDHIIHYLTRRSLLTGFEDIYYNNGKWLYQAIVCLTEKSVST